MILALWAPAIFFDALIQKSILDVFLVSLTIWLLAQTWNAEAAPSFVWLTIGLSLGGTTGYAINPARDLAPRIAHFLLPIRNKRDSDWSYAWIPVVAPIVGGRLAALFARAL